MGEFSLNYAFVVASFCLVVYDTLLTLSRELECIWRRKFSLITVIFVLQRWVLVLDGIGLVLPVRHRW
ncbi:hypothetical protein EIP91_009241 [Steccherinum ochraceum]|uniref:DUF6533 domain-containing protein n=1 Tax=Steccherinum ochraceum TaxID=92696 RepID=A0A4R0R473_9APHY|nr:hypothetical protein EIP91_009241 [Steccherinum ochraceum]